MHDIRVEVRTAQRQDLERIIQLQQQARRSCVRFGYEDLLNMIERNYCYIADTGPLLWGFIAATVRQPGLAQLRGLSLINGWRLDEGLSQLLNSLEAALRRDQIRFLMHLNQESWLLSPLLRRGFATHDYIVDFERRTSIRALVPLHGVADAVLRYLRPNEIGSLTALDHRSFAWPWQLSSGELVQLMLTRSRLVVLAYEGVLRGNACTDVYVNRAHIIRLAVDPAYQGRGLGRLLLADALDFAAFAGAELITLNTQWQNTTSQRLYQGFGFRMVGRRVPVLIRTLS